MEEVGGAVNGVNYECWRVGDFSLTGDVGLFAYEAVVGVERREPRGDETLYSLVRLGHYVNSYIRRFIFSISIASSSVREGCEESPYN